MNVLVLDRVERRQLHQREQQHRRWLVLPSVPAWLKIMVDDGIAILSTMLAAVNAVKSAGAERVVIAAPVAASQGISGLFGVGKDTRTNGSLPTVSRCLGTRTNIGPEN